jgi:hypothetical protein
MRSRLMPLAAMAVSFLLISPASAFVIPLSDEAIREAYFLGQRNDGKTSEFFEKYTHHPPFPEEGPHVASVQFQTPYAYIVELSRQHGLGNSAQDALQEYKKHGDVVRVIINIEFTPSYGALIDTPIHSRSGPTNGYQLRSSNFWRDFSYRLFQRDALIEPLDIRGEGTYGGSGESTVLVGAIVTVLYDASKISPTDDADVVVDTTAGQQSVTTFDLASLR